MNIDLIRAIDKWMGIPACLALSAAHKVSTWLRKEPLEPSDRHDKPKNILFIELSEMGSVVLAYPAMQHVKDIYPDARLYFLIFERNRYPLDILKIIPASQVITIRMRSTFHFLWSTYQALKAIHRAGIDTVLDLELFSRFSALLSGLSGARRRVGYTPYFEEGLYRGGFITHPVYYNCHQHMAKNFLALVKALERPREYPLVKAAIDDKALEVPLFRSSQRDLEALRGRLGRINPSVHTARQLVLLNPGAGLLPIRAWPVENYAGLVERILQRFSETTVVIIGTDDAKAAADQIMSRVEPGSCMDFTGKTSFKDLLDLFNLADVLVTADSGPPHFAALTTIKTVVLYGPETPVLYAPLGSRTTCLFAGLSCSPCLSAYNHRKSACRDPQCMSAISVDQVFNVVARLLEESP
ncbi:MAG: glycosyltransferase family 9 protein [Deltaproteobacteria bacterium]|nr:glycosyltransferase family 9 protein [Deltaproteobacteria bacterium]